MNVNRDKVNLLSDTILYDEAIRFAEQHQMPDKQQLTGLAVFSRSWQELLDYIKHQVERDWGQQKSHYEDFYKELSNYLNAAQRGLRQRVRTEFALVESGLGRRQERAILDTWAQALAQEFVQHLVAEATMQSNIR
jgi:hypothetical protein